MIRFSAVVAAFAMVSGCAAQFESEEGQAVAQITNVPSQVSCIRLTVKGVTRTVERKFSVSSGQSATLTMNALPTGEVTFVGDAFSQLCGSVSATTAPNWSSDPSTVYLWAGAMSNVPLQFKRTSNVTVTVDFVEDAGGGPGDLSWPSWDFSWSIPDGGSTPDLVWSPPDAGADFGGAGPGDLAWAPPPDLGW